MYKEEEIRNAENQCTKEYSEAEEAVNPLKDDEAMTTFTCDKCDFTSTSMKGLNVHKETFSLSMKLIQPHSGS